MLVEVEKQQLCMNQLIAKKNDVVKVEGDIIVNDVKPDVLSILNTNGIVCVYKKEVMDGKLRIDGCINTYIMYLADDENGSARSLNTTLDFTQIIDLEKCKVGMSVDENIILKSIESKIINGRKISINAMMDIATTVYANECIDIIDSVNNQEDVQMLNETIKLNTLIGEGSNIVYAKDTVMLNETDDLAELMKVDFRIINKDSKTSYNKVVTKADAEIKMMYLTEDNRINTINAIIPIMGFVDIENITDNSMCDIKYKLKNLIIKPNSGDASNSIYVEAEIEISCLAYENKEISLIKDLYSTENDFKCKENEITIMTRRDAYLDVYRFNQEVIVPEISNNKIYDISVNPNVITTRIQGNTLSYEGDLNIKFIYRNNEVVETKEVTTPLMFTMQLSNINPTTNISTDIEVRKDNFITGNNGKINADIELGFTAIATDYERINLINEIEKSEMSCDNSYSMVIYFVKEGDTLWKIAKKFKTRVEDIVRLNNIEDENKIKVGQQLYIPKYVKRSVAV